MSLRSIRKPVLGLIAVTLLVVLSWMLIGLTTVNKGIDLCTFDSAVHGACRGVGLLVVVACRIVVCRQKAAARARRKSQAMAEICQAELEARFQRVGPEHARDITRLFYGNRPRGGDRASELMRLYVAGSEEMNAR